MNKKKTILMILDHEFPPDPRVSNEIEILNEAGINVVLASFTKKDAKKAEAINDKFTVLRKPISKFTHKTSVGALKFPFYFNFWRKFLAEIAEKHEFHAVHAHDLPMAKVGLEIAQKKEVPFILDLHENWPDMLSEAKHTNTFLGKLLSSNRQWSTFEAEMIRKSDYVITVCQEMSDRLSKTSDITQKTHEYQNVPNLEKLHIPVIDEKKDFFELIYAGGITESRGIQTVLSAIFHIKSELENFKFSIIGDGVYKKYLEDKTHELEIENFVSFEGWIDQSSVMKRLMQADLAIIPHNRSPQNDNSSPNKIFQYMLSKTPVVSSDCLSLKRLVEETKCGKIYTHNNSQELGEIITELIKKPESLKEFGENGFNAVMTKYNTEQEGNKLKLFYHKVFA